MQFPHPSLTSENVEERNSVQLQEEDKTRSGTKILLPPVNIQPESIDNNQQPHTIDGFFVDGVLLQNTNEMTGTFVQRPYTNEKVQCDLPMARKLQVYKQNIGYEEYHKDIVTHIIPELRKRKDVLGLSDWLHFDDYNIKERLLLEMEKILLSVSMRDIAIFDVLRVTTNVLNCCFQAKLQADDTLCLPLRVLTCSFTILFVLISNTSNADVFSQVQDLSRRAHSDLNSLRRIPHSMAAGQINVIVSILEYFSKNSFQRGITENALSEPNEQNILREFIPLEYPSKFIYISTLINKMLQNSYERTEELLHIVLKWTFDTMSKKQSTRQQLQPLLYTVNKGIVLKLLQGPEHGRDWNESKKCLIATLVTYLISGRIDLTWRRKMLESLNPLLFVADKDIVKEIIKIFEKCGHKHKHIRNVIIKHVQNLLSAVNLRLFCFQRDTESSDKPVWSEFQGKIWNGLGVTLHLLLPSVKCLTKGSMEDYRTSADDKETKRHINCLEIMRLLQYDKSHQNLLKLIGYQYRPLPLFYLTESQKKFHTYLLERRQYHKWLPRTKLCRMAIDVINAVKYIHSKGVVHRNLTTYSFSINDQDVIKLHDFSLAKILPHTEHNTSSFINAVHDGDVPFLYSAPESVLKDKYDFCSDTWMVGLLLYGIYTHGGIPYTVDGLNSEQILEYIIFQDLKPTKWPCIPKDIFKAIMSCMHSNADNRGDLNAIKTILTEHLASCNEAKFNRLSSLFEIDKMYPPPACTVPDKGLPPLFARLKQDLNPRASYYNIRSSMLRPNKCCITLSDVTPPDAPIRNGQEHSRYMTVEEPVTQAFVEDELPQLSEQLCLKVLKMIEMPVKIKRNGNRIYNFDYILHYKCYNGENVIDMALRNHFGAPGIDSTDIMYLGLVYNFVKFVQRMHCQQWLLRDLCGYSIFVDATTLSVFMPRLGRFRRMNTTIKMDDCILDDTLTDRIRWLPIEVIQHGLYSKESDIYMLGMTIWEIYTALDLCRDNPTANPLEGKPFAKIPKDELLTELYSGEIPCMPSSCPIWLYEMLKCCWNRNRTFRPSADYLLEEVKSKIQSHPRSDKLTHIVDLKQKPSTSVLRSLKTQPPSTQWEESTYLSIVHERSRANSLEQLDSLHETSDSISQIAYQIKPAAVRKLPFPGDEPDDDYPKLRSKPGRFINKIQPSGIYHNDPDSDVLNISFYGQSHSLSPTQETISEDDETIESLVVEASRGSRHMQPNTEENSLNNDENTLSRVDSGIEEDVPYKRKSVDGTRSIPEIPTRKPGNIPPIPKIPMSIPKQQSDTKLQSSELKCKTTFSKHYDGLKNKSERDVHPENTDHLVNLRVSATERRKASIQISRSKDDIDIGDAEPKLERFRSCYLFRPNRMFALSGMSKRESHV